MEARQHALVLLLEHLKVVGYRFVTPTPATHRTVLRRAPGALARNLRDVFGWSLPFEDGVLAGDIVSALDLAGLQASGARRRV